jgi:hypothetical protein
MSKYSIHEIQCPHCERKIKVNVADSINVTLDADEFLTFTNEKEVASKATADLVNGLSVWCEDDSYGNYYIYG